MSTHNICIRREIRKISAFFRWKKHLICCYEPVSSHLILIHVIIRCGLNFALWPLYASTDTPKSTNERIRFHDFRNSGLIVLQERWLFDLVSYSTFCWYDPDTSLVLWFNCNKTVSALIYQFHYIAFSNIQLRRALYQGYIKYSWLSLSQTLITQTTA